MDDELTDAAPRKPETIPETFDRWFPFYLSIGMSSAEYWDGDASLPRYFRKAFKMRQERENELAWLHGLYFYDAVTSAMSHLSKDKKDHRGYTPKPYASSKEEFEEEEKEKTEEAQAQAEVWMKSWAAATQKMFEKN